MDQFEDFESAVDNKSTKVEETKETEDREKEVEHGEEQEEQEEQEDEGTEEGDESTSEVVDYKKLYEEEQARSRKAAEKLLALDPFALDEETPEEKTAREVAEAETRKTTEVKSEQKVETKVAEVKIDVPVELTDEQIEDIIEKPAKFREFLKARDSQLATELAKQMTPVIKEAIMKDVVSIQGRLTENVVKALVAIDTFFAQNPDLGKEGTRQTVEDMAAGIKAKRPGLSAAECLKEAGSRIRTHLRIAAPADKGFTKVAGTGTTQTRQVVSAPSKLESEIEMFEKAGRG